MADGMTVTGLNELRAAVTNLPARVLAASRAVASASAQRICADAKARLLAQMKTDRHALADAITVAEDAANRQFNVDSKSPRGQPGNLVLWVEYGTVKQPARPYMHPAAAAEDARYRSDMQAVVDAVVQEALG